MKIYFDWKIARVVDDVGNIIDEIGWDGNITPSSLAKRLFSIQKGRLPPEVKTLSERFPEADIDVLGPLSDPLWPNHEDFVEIHHRATVELAKMGVAESSGDMDRRIDMLVSAAVETRASWTTSESRCVEWAGLFITELDLDSQRVEIPTALSKSDNIEEASEILGVIPPKHLPSDLEWDSLKSQATFVLECSSVLNKIESAIRESAMDYLPSLSALMGPISAAKLVSLAGGRERLARMPSGSLQVLGAHAAMAAHRRGAPPPKHGAILFSLPQVSRSPRWVRGKIARFLAGKASIAVRIDHFNGVPWGESQINEINSEIDSIKNKFSKPSKRK
ncbi:MAG: hypothetical protein CMA12_02615 [Euryarchaeota archaeon]|nr:hypothetical protein [Euryarchaeota archaeon]OUW22744.1 MAG: hypothetical protein CBD33_01185 [Euryarchaeota archaeon TMED173]